MNRNMGTLDRLVRPFVVAPVLIVLGFVLGAGSVLGIVASRPTAVCALADGSRGAAQH